MTSRFRSVLFDRDMATTRVVPHAPRHALVESSKTWEQLQASAASLVGVECS